MASPPTMPYPPTAAWAAEIARFVGAARGQAELGDALGSYIEGDSAGARASVDYEVWIHWAEMTATIKDSAGGWAGKLARSYYTAAAVVVDDAERVRLDSWWTQFSEAAAMSVADAATVTAEAAQRIRDAGSGLSAAASLLKSPLTWLLALAGGYALSRRRS